MIAPSPESQTNPDAVGIDVNAITRAYRDALADEVERRIVAEASVQALLTERAELRETIHALSAGGPTTEGA